ncbi:substrate-binding domain-containing protein [Oribacterium sp. P6A1]|uniref:substrate-binding domain-containing protein n=1 Tax=Oribacterium sp. P6A1 TaxID=1410612 RepID=UPI000559D438|nr:substrate-binding domain-containing protein [Oribacterium sp. P6A1]
MKFPRDKFLLLNYFGLPVLLLATAYLVMSYYDFAHTTPLEINEEELYQYHFAMITNGQNSTYWENVYEGACEAAKPYKAYVEQVGKSIREDTSVADKLEMARYSNYDGVLVYPEDSLEVEQNIDALVAEGVPVITLQRDSDKSKRQAFVGVNDYFLGQAYGRRLKEMGRSNSQYISVLFPGSTYGQDNRKWFLQGLKNSLGTEDYSIDYQIVKDEGGLSNAENIIDKLITGIGDHRAPDSIICLNNEITELAYQIISDRGMLDKSSIIGSYISESIIEDIIAGDIKFTIIPNPDDLGKKAVGELIRYRKYGVANYSGNVEFIVVDKQNAAEYWGGFQ